MCKKMISKLNIHDFSKQYSIEYILKSHPEYTITYVKERFIGLTPIKLKNVSDPNRTFYFRKNKCIFECEKYKYTESRIWIDSLTFYELKPHNISDRHLKEVFKLLYDIEVCNISNYSFNTNSYKRRKSIFGTLLNE